MPDNTSTSDLDLIWRSREGDRAAFATLYDRKAPMVMGIITGILNNDSEKIYEALQRTFVEFKNVIDRNETPGREINPNTWILFKARFIALQLRGGTYSEGISDLSCICELVIFKGLTIEQAAERFNISKGELFQALYAEFKDLKAR